MRGNTRRNTEDDKEKVNEVNIVRKASDKYHPIILVCQELVREK